MGLLIALSVLLGGVFGHAQENTFETALKLYQEQKYAEAEEAFRRFAAENANNKFALYNWGLAAYQAGRKGLAVGTWRRALTLDPDFTPALAALNFAKTEMPEEVFTAQANRWEQLRASVLERTTLDRFYGLTVLSFLFAAGLLLHYWGSRRRALKDETPLPPFPTVGAFFAALFVCCALLLAAKIVADQETRATVITSGVPARSGPHEQDNPLFELMEGTQVTVRRRYDNWMMITSSAGLSGWVPVDALIITSGSI